MKFPDRVSMPWLTGDLDLSVSQKLEVADKNRLN